MNKMFGILILLVSLSGCAIVQNPMIGFVYTKSKYPVAVTSNVGGTKVGTSKAQCFLGIVSVGDASIEAAKKEAGIKKVSHVDCEGLSMLGVYATYTTIVYGE